MTYNSRDAVPTPAYIVEEEALIHNLEVLQQVEAATGCKILLAQKCFSMFYEYPLIGRYISGCTASGLYEARLGAREMGKENHVFSPAYRDGEFDEIVSYCDHISFNSLSQLAKYGNRTGGKSFGLRINPECSTQGDHAIYDPCAPGSRLGTSVGKLIAAAGGSGEVLDEAMAQTLMEGVLQGVEGLHFHTLCEQLVEPLEETLAAVEAKFGPLLSHMKWLNMGGGHHITAEGYDVKCLIALIQRIQNTYGVTVYLEPGEAVALNAGVLKTTVLDVVEQDGITTLILDASAACHMPDVLEMPYRPPLQNSGMPGEKAYTYRLSSYTCLAGDVIGDYSFDVEVGIGDVLYFEDMAIYSMVKNNTFNGIGLPLIVAQHTDGSCEVVRSFGYEDFKMRLS